MAKHIPSTRDRVNWKVYGRVFEMEDGSIILPRAIVYTSTWYAMGLPPTLLDAPFILESAKNDGLDLILKLLPMYRKELEYDARFFDRSQHLSTWMRTSLSR